MTTPKMAALRASEALRNASRVNGHVSLDCLPYLDVLDVCDRCGTALTNRQIRWCSRTCSRAYTENHAWQFARVAAMKRDGHACIRCGKAARCDRWGLEVDHIAERRGVPLHQHSCLHHQDNLRTLCHECHRTRYQWEAA